jgi:dolichol-phosphate mannosyltransferase
MDVASHLSLNGRIVVVVANWNIAAIVWMMVFAICAPPITRMNVMNDLKKPRQWVPRIPGQEKKEIVAIVIPVSDFEADEDIDKHLLAIRNSLKKHDIYNQRSNLDEVIIIIHRGGFLADAYLDGFETALEKGADKIIEMDLGHDAHILPRIVDLLDFYPVVYTTRIHPSASFKSPLHRKAVSRLGSFLGQKLLFRWTGFIPSDLTSGFIGYRREVIEAIDEIPFESTGHFYQTEMKYNIHRLGWNFIEVPMNYNQGSSSLKLASIIEAAVVFVKLWIPIIKYDLTRMKRKIIK